MARRKFDVFSMSFLDAICCGFGSMVLIFMLITAQGAAHVRTVTDQRRAAALAVEQQRLAAAQRLAALDASLAAADQAQAATAALAARLRAELAASQGAAGERRARLARLDDELATADASAQRLAAAARDPGGAALQSFPGNGDRLYLTGLRVGGRHVLILLDASASMLDETLVNILRMRNMPDERKLRSEKWRQAVAIVDWLATQLPPAAEFQIYTFNTRAEPLVAGSAGRWLRLDAPTLGRALGQLRSVVPRDGTSLANAFAVATELTPQPDNLILITDGLPTQGRELAPKRLVTAAERLRLLERAIAMLPKALPVSTILLPMEGDPAAPSAFWNLAKATQGSFLAPSRDWP
jgi:hypothetical protein